MKKYEIMYIVKAGLEEEARKAEIEKVNGSLSTNGSKVLEVSEMGLRELAYPINDEVKGYYVVVTANVDIDTLNEFNRVVKLNNNILRHLVLVAE